MTTDEIKSKVIDYANGYGIDPNVALVQIGRESSFDPSRVGALGERGLGQFMPGTWATYGYGSFDNAFDVDYNLTAWGNYMSALLNMFGWDYRKALQGYNGGEGNVQRGTVSGAAQGYADTILAQAGAVSQTPPDDGSGQRNWILIGAVGLGIFALVMAFRD